MNSIISVWFIIKAGLHRNANTNPACENDAYVHVGKFVDCSAFAEAANQPYTNVLYANSLWCTDSRRIAFGYSPNIRHTAECCLPRLRNMSTSNNHIVFACHILFAFRCKHGLTIMSKYFTYLVLWIMILASACILSKPSFHYHNRSYKIGNKAMIGYFSIF